MKRWLEDPSEHNELVEFNMKHKFRILGSCNGLLCLFNKDHGYVKLWNPSIGFESINSPTPDCFDKCKYIMFIRYYGFGYDHVNDKYKVLVIVRRLSGRPLENVTQIYTFGENCWTTIQNIPFDSNTPLGKFVSGTLNWLVVIKGVDSTSRQSVILSFDLEKETYKELLLPENDGVKAYNHMLGVFNNCLCVVYFDSNETVLDFWLMKSYGVAESWTRLMTILPQRLFPVCRILYSPTDLTFIIGNGIVLTTTSNISLLHNYFNNGRLNLQLIRSEHGWDQHIYHESLVAPQC